MTMSREAVAHQLAEAAHLQYPVRIRRDRDWWCEPVYGFVVSVSGRWVAVQRLVDSVYIDGYEVLRISDITDVDPDHQSDHVEKGLSSLGRPEVDFYLPAHADTPDVLEAAARHSVLVGIHLEMDGPTTMLVGVITELRKRKFDIQLIGPRGEWVVDSTSWWYGDVTRVVLGNRYTLQLERFGDARPTRTSLERSNG